MQGTDSPVNFIATLSLHLASVIDPASNRLGSLHAVLKTRGQETVRTLLAQQQGLYLQVLQVSMRC